MSGCKVSCHDEQLDHDACTSSLLASRAVTMVDGLLRAASDSESISSLKSNNATLAIEVHHASRFFNYFGTT